MNVLIASSDAVFARMLELEFLERGISCVTAGTQDEADAVPAAKLAVIDAKLLLSEHSGRRLSASLSSADIPRSWGSFRRRS